MSFGPASRAGAREIFLRALAECGIEQAFARHLRYEGGALRICDDLYDLRRYSRVLAISMGKAGHRMAEALAGQVGAAVSGIISDPNPPPCQLPGYRYFTGGHPWPNEESFRAAHAILKSLAALEGSEESLVLFMMSGGGSAAVEKAASPAVTPRDMVAAHRSIVHCGAPIAHMNVIRKHLSAVKGGRMAAAAQGARQVSILVSDVPEGALDSLASGPTMPDASTVDDCHRIAREYQMLENFPPSVRRLFEQGALEETPKPGDPVFVRSRWWTILSSATAAQAALAQAKQWGLERVELDNRCDDWDYARAADYLLDRLRRLRRGASGPVCLVSAGEVTVKVDRGPGGGGRNQQFALYCAEKIAGEKIAVLSAGTDGIDGNSPAAGGVVDGTTLERARALGLDVAERLRTFNAFPLLDQLGDAIRLGPTGTNVRDLRILLAEPAF